MANIVKVNIFDPLTFRKKCPYLELFWSTFCRIRTEYGEIWSIQSKFGKMRTRISPNTNTFHVIWYALMLLRISRSKLLTLVIFYKLLQRRYLKALLTHLHIVELNTRKFFLYMIFKISYFNFLRIAK